MFALPVGQKSLTQAVSQWWREWTRRGSRRLELKCCGEEEVERMAKDIGMSAAELRTLANRGSDSADPLLLRIEALELDRNEGSRTEPRTFLDLQLDFTMLKQPRRCRRGTC